MAKASVSMSIRDFLKGSPSDILADIMSDQLDITSEQKFAWEEEVAVLKAALVGFEHGTLLFEYEIPRLMKRVDVIVLYAGIIFVIEFKANKADFETADIDQCMDYALDLKNFHQQSATRTIVPILVSTAAKRGTQDPTTPEIHRDGIYCVTCAAPGKLAAIIKNMEKVVADADIDPTRWQNSAYYPTPTIIEAAQRLYRGHKVDEIGSPERTASLNALIGSLDGIIRHSKKTGQKSVCFVTGIPGSGKTLAGLNLVSHRHELDEDDRTIFLSGNASLVNVLQRALVLDHKQREGGTIKDAERLVGSFIQHMYQYRHNSLTSTDPLAERIVVFDEAQRAWTQDELAKFLKKYGTKTDKSEPGLLMETLDRREDWAVLVCLVGGGQEINRGEIGMPGWFSAIRDDFTDWHVYLSDKIMGMHQMKGTRLDGHLAGLEHTLDDKLHLSESYRSFRDPSVFQFINSLIDEADSPRTDRSCELVREFDESYPIRITRSIDKAKEWIKSKAGGTERYGLIAHHDSYRLRPYGICIDPKLDVEKWFLDDSKSVYSSYYMEQIASEFKIQGLELDWACVCWDANLRYNDGWSYNEFRGTRWIKINREERMTHLKNSYRVLLTRARQGMVIFVPLGDVADDTRRPVDYDGVYGYLKSMGIKELAGMRQEAAAKIGAASG